MSNVRKLEATFQEGRGDAAFAEYVTSTAFSLTLNKNQVTLLYFLARYGYIEGEPRWNQYKESVLSQSRRDFVGVVRALIRRGLVTHHWIKDAPKGWQYYRVTKAGKLVFKMIQLSGIVQEEKRKAA